MEKLLYRQFVAEETDDSVHFEFRNPQPPFPLHSHDFTELAVVYGGRGVHVTQTSESVVEAGDVAIIKPGQVHGYGRVEDLALMNILINPSFFSDDILGLASVSACSDLFYRQGPRMGRTETNGEDDIVRLKLNELQLFEARKIIESMQDEKARRAPAFSVANIAHLAQLLILLLRIYNNPAYPASVNGNASEAVKYVERNFRKKITIQDLARYFNMSESTVLRAFKRMTGCAPSKFQTRQRMLAAMRELASTTRGVTEIAYNVGFNDSNYFSRCFKRFAGTTPMEYRKRFGAPPQDVHARVQNGSSPS